MTPDTPRPILGCNMPTTRKPRTPARFRKYVELARASGAAEARIIPTRYVVTAEWVRLKCQFGCSGYSKRLCCPPYTPTPETTRRVLDEYRHALIYCYDFPRAKPTRKRTQPQVAELERTAFLDGLYRAFALGAGPCRLCTECDTSRRCKHPSEARPSMESAGIDVYATCRNAGIRLEVAVTMESEPRYVHLLLLE